MTVIFYLNVTQISINNFFSKAEFHLVAKNDWIAPVFVKGLWGETMPSFRKPDLPLLANSHHSARIQGVLPKHTTIAS
jgi:hypothetical protein